MAFYSLSNQLLKRIIGPGVFVTKKYALVALNQCNQSNQSIKVYLSNHQPSFTVIRTLKLSSTDMSFKEEKEKFLAMALEDKRKQYKTNKYLTLADLPTWEQYCKENQKDLFKSAGSKICEPNPELNRRVSLWRGDITKLEVDAVVNAANKPLAGGSGVDGAIHKAAGPNLLKECSTLNGCEVGQAKLTGGYCMPAKYVIQTVGPQGVKPDKLRSCYQESLNLLISQQLRTVAFPCISTGVYGYPQREAAEVAISTVKKNLEANMDKVDRVIFCVFLESDQDFYEDLMQQYFPVA